MDNKKLIGTILGVIAFIALIAGATFAWLTITANVTNSSYSIKTMNFSVNFTKGTNVTEVPIVVTPTTTNTKSLSVKANKITGSAPGKLTIYLNTANTTSQTLLTSGVLHYAVCIGTCTGTTNLSVASNVSSTGSVTGTVTNADSLKLALLSDTELQSSATTYNIYFWLDSATVDETIMGETYTGYISAEAQQHD